MIVILHNYLTPQALEDDLPIHVPLQGHWFFGNSCTLTFGIRDFLDLCKHYLPIAKLRFYAALHRVCPLNFPSTDLFFRLVTHEKLSLLVIFPLKHQLFTRGQLNF